MLKRTFIDIVAFYDLARIGIDVTLAFTLPDRRCMRFLSILLHDLLAGYQMQRSEIDLGRDFFGLVLEERWLGDHRITTSCIIVAGQRRLERHLDFILTCSDSALSMALSFEKLVRFFWRQLAVDYVDAHGLQVVHESRLLFFIVL